MSERSRRLPASNTVAGNASGDERLESRTSYRSHLLHDIFELRSTLLKFNTSSCIVDSQRVFEAFLTHDESFPQRKKG